MWDVYGFVAYRVANRTEAQDLTQQTFEQALRAWPRFDPSRGSVSTWLMAIARNLVIDHHRSGRLRRHQSVDDLGTAEPSAEEEYDFGIDPELHRALATLSPRDREVVELRYGGDLSGPEIAETTGLSLANVQQILSRSLRRLREAMDASAGERARAGHAQRSQHQ